MIIYSAIKDPDVLDKIINSTMRHMHDDQDNVEEPKKRAIVVHINQAKFDFAISLSLTHILMSHCGCDGPATERAITLASQAGRAVVKYVSADIGETIQREIDECAFNEDRDYKVSVEAV